MSEDTSMNNPEVQVIPEGSVITDAMIADYQEAYRYLNEDGTPADTCNRDVAIGGLLAFEQGHGQPSTDLFDKYPSLAAKYYMAVAARNNAVPETDSETQTDTDTESESETQADSEADTDTDSETESEEPTMEPEEEEADA